MRTGPGYTQTLTLWDVATGRFLAEMELPRDEKPVPGKLRVYHMLGNVYDIRFSPDDRYVALAGIEQRNMYHDPKPDGPVLVWRLSDRKRVLWVRTPGRACARRVCFNATGNRIACVARGLVGMWWQSVKVFIWDIPTGKLVARKSLGGNAMHLTWDEPRRAFVVHLADGSQVHVPNPQTTGAPQTP